MLQGRNILAATVDFKHRLDMAAFSRFRAGKVSMEDDDRPKRKTHGLDFNKYAQGPASEAQRAGFPISVQNGVAVIAITGAMERFADGWWSQCSTAECTVAVQSAMADPEVGCTVAVVNTPGGSVDGLAELGDAVKAHAESGKPFYAQVEGMMASAGYYACANATAIYAHRMDEVGSLGTLMMTYDFSQYLKNEGIDPVLISTGAHKGAGAFGMPITADHRAEFQRVVDQYGADFKKQIQGGRELTPTQASAVFDGRIWVASDAHDLGLIDGIKTTQETLAKAAGKAAASVRNRSARASLRKTLGLPNS